MKAVPYALCHGRARHGWLLVGGVLAEVVSAERWESGVRVHFPVLAQAGYFFADRHPGENRL